MVTPKIYHYYGDRHRLCVSAPDGAAFPPRIKQIGANAPDGPSSTVLYS
jgi:hypothetical protein